MWGSSILIYTAIPKGHFSAHEIIETYFPDVSKSLEQNNTLKKYVLNTEKAPTELHNTSQRESTTTTKQKTNKLDKRPLLKEEDAEKELLATIFNITIIN